MDTQETKEQGFTPLQSVQIKIDQLSIGFDWLKFLGKSIFPFLALFAGFVFFLFTRLESRLESRIDRIESKLDLLIQKQTSQQEAKQSPAKRQAKR